MINNPELSIIVPVYKVEQWLSACIDSIISQTYTDWELILVDDGSPDRSGQICDEYAAKDNRIIVMHKANAGVSAARNDALDIARGKYITFVDSDDELGTPTTIEENIKILISSTGIDLVQYPVLYSDAEGASTLKYAESKYYQSSAILAAISKNEIAGYLCGKIFSAYLFEGVRLPVDIKMAEDTWCLIDIAKKTNTLYVSDRGYYKYCLHSSSATNTFDASKCFDLFKMSFKLFLELNEHFAVDSEIVVNYFFVTFKRLLDVKIAYSDNIELGEEVLVLKSRVPNIKWILRKTLNVKQRIWLFCIKFLGLNVFAVLYTKLVLIRLKVLKK